MAPLISAPSFVLAAPRGMGDTHRFPFLSQSTTRLPEVAPGASLPGSGSSSDAEKSVQLPPTLPPTLRMYIIYMGGIVSLGKQGGHREQWAAGGAQA